MVSSDNFDMSSFRGKVFLKEEHYLIDDRDGKLPTALICNLSGEMCF
jgi:hypothetical protein